MGCFFRPRRQRLRVRVAFGAFSRPVLPTFFPRPTRAFLCECCWKDAGPGAGVSMMHSAGVSVTPREAFRGSALPRGITRREPPGGVRRRSEPPPGQKRQDGRSVVAPRAGRPARATSCSRAWRDVLLLVGHHPPTRTHEGWGGARLTAPYMSQRCRGKPRRDGAAPAAGTAAAGTAAAGTAAAVTPATAPPPPSVPPPRNGRPTPRQAPRQASRHRRRRPPLTRRRRGASAVADVDLAHPAADVVNAGRRPPPPTLSMPPRRETIARGRRRAAAAAAAAGGGYGRRASPFAPPPAAPPRLFRAAMGGGDGTSPPPHILAGAPLPPVPPPRPVAAAVWLSSARPPVSGGGASSARGR